MTVPPKITVIIPVRFGSTRFPGKPLADLCGKPVIRHVYERALQWELVSQVLVATDDERIRSTVEAFGGRVVMTASFHLSGTDRIAEAADIIGLAPEEVVVNIQGDQPLFEPAQIGEVVGPLMADQDLQMSTLIYRIEDEEEITHPGVVKTVCDADGYALYFSRATIPHVRDKGNRADYYKHHGIYAYRRSFLAIFPTLPEGTLERLEALEQLRPMERGYRIKVVESRFDSLEIDTPRDLERAREILTRKG